MMNYLKRIGIYILIIALSAFAGFILLILARMIPLDYIIPNGELSLELLSNGGTTWEGVRRYMWDGISGSRLDDVTDGLMVNIAMQYDTSVFKSAVTSYGRYWNGYLVYLCPALAFFSVSVIRVINFFGQSILIIVNTMLFVYKKRTALAASFLAMWMSLSPIALFYSMQYSSIFYPTMIAIMLLLLFNDSWDQIHRGFFFLSIGITIAYFDLLTYPIVSVGVPLIFFLALDCKNIKPFVHRIKELVFYGFSWGFGYAGMWVSKWVIGTIITDENWIINAINKLSVRVSRKGGYVNTIKKEMAMMISPLLVFSCIALVLFYILMLIIHPLKTKINWPVVLMIALTMLLPFAWYAFAMEHSYGHSYMTYRNLCVTFYGLGILPSLLIDFDNYRDKYRQKLLHKG